MDVLILIVMGLLLMFFLPGLVLGLVVGRAAGRRSLAAAQRAAWEDGVAHGRQQAHDAHEQTQRLAATAAPRRPALLDAPRLLEAPSRPEAQPPPVRPVSPSAPADVPSPSFRRPAPAPPAAVPTPPPARPGVTPPAEPTVPSAHDRPWVRDHERQSRRNIGITLAGSTLLLVAAASAFVGTLVSPTIRLLCLTLVLLGLLVGGGVLHARSTRLRPAAVALVGGGLAMLPVLGVLLDLEILHRPALSWLLTSVVGVALASAMAVWMRSPVVAHLAAAFIASASLASGAALRAGLVWALALGLGTSILICWATASLSVHGRGAAVVEALRRQHPWFGYGLAAVGLAVGLLSPRGPIGWGELAVLLALAAVYAGSRWWTRRRTDADEPARESAPDTAGTFDAVPDALVARAAGLGALVSLLVAVEAPAHTLVLTAGAGSLACVLAVFLGLRHPSPVTAGGGPRLLSQGEAGGWACLFVLSAMAEPAVATGRADLVLLTAAIVLGSAALWRLPVGAGAVRVSLALPVLGVVLAVPAGAGAHMWPWLWSVAVAALVPAWIRAHGLADPRRRARAVLVGMSLTCLGVIGLVWVWSDAAGGDGELIGRNPQTLLTGGLAVLAGWAGARHGLRCPRAAWRAPALAAWALWSTAAVAVLLPLQQPWAALWGLPVWACLAITTAGVPPLLDGLTHRHARTGRADLIAAVPAALLLVAALAGTARPPWQAGVLGLVGAALGWVLLLGLGGPRLSPRGQVLGAWGAQAMVSAAGVRAAAELGAGATGTVAALTGSLLLGAALQSRVRGLGPVRGLVEVWGRAVVLLVAALSAAAAAERLAALIALAGIALLALLEPARPAPGLPRLRWAALFGVGIAAALVTTDLLPSGAGPLGPPWWPAAVAGPVLTVLGAVLPLVAHRHGRGLLPPPLAGDHPVIAVLHRPPAQGAALVAAGLVASEAAPFTPTAPPWAGWAPVAAWLCLGVLCSPLARVHGRPAWAAAGAPLTALALMRAADVDAVSRPLTSLWGGEAIGAVVLAAGLIGALPAGVAVLWRGRPELHGALGTVLAASALTLLIPAPTGALLAAAVLLQVTAWPTIDEAARVWGWDGRLRRSLRLHLLTLAVLVAALLVDRLVPVTTLGEALSRLWWLCLALTLELALVAALDRRTGTLVAASGAHTLGAAVVLLAGPRLETGPVPAALVALVGFVAMVAVGLTASLRTLLWWGVTGCSLSVMYTLSELFYLWLVLLAAGLFGLGVVRLLRRDAGTGERTPADR
ncbi:hypothetical protein [Micrococcus sp.]|uniref:hypothetical protein n=1 Tax=Micrococcus sp. TaxID=1271 RepID=UPI002A91A89F|nr:hypothetical protein [Micrococcus sp.]MDY6055943.1 hypothetical protein [Micrococcus sp.]